MKQIYGRKYITASDVKEYKVKIIANKGSVYLDFLPDVRKDAEALKRAHEDLCNAIIQTDIFKSFFNDEGAGT